MLWSQFKPPWPTFQSQLCLFQPLKKQYYLRFGFAFVIVSVYLKLELTEFLLCPKHCAEHLIYFVSFNPLLPKRYGVRPIINFIVQIKELSASKIQSLAPKWADGIQTHVSLLGPHKTSLNLPLCVTPLNISWKFLHFAESSLISTTTGPATTFFIFFLPCFRPHLFIILYLYSVCSMLICV